jgi:hypothetical protein
MEANVHPGPIYHTLYWDDDAHITREDNGQAWHSRSSNANLPEFDVVQTSLGVPPETEFESLFPEWVNSSERYKGQNYQMDGFNNINANVTSRLVLLHIYFFRIYVFFQYRTY